MSRITSRRSVVLLAVSVATAATLALRPALAQQEEEAPTTTVAGQAEEAMPMQMVTRADTFTTGTWEMAVDEVFTAVSPIRHGYTEVRVGVTMRNVGAEDVGYRMDGFFTDPNYPRLGITDSSGNERPLRAAQSTSALLPGSTLSTVPPGVTARWTVGFQVPTAFVDDLDLVVHGTGGDAAFDLSSQVGAFLAEPGPGATIIGMGDTIDWGEEFTASAFGYGTVVCGDPDRQLAVQIVAVGFDVGNRTAFDADWPGVRFPDNLAIAQWANGGSARFAFETFSGDFDPLLKWAGDAARFPAGGDGNQASATYQRALLFAAPRDARLGGVDDDPIDVWLRPPGSEPVWLDLGGGSDIAINPSLCDEGNFDFAIPFSFAPGGDFVVGLAVPEPDPEGQDLAARELLSEALVIAGSYRAGNDDSYEGMTAGALSALWNRVTFNSGFVVAVGEVGVTTSVNEETGDTLGILVTESASGTVLCTNDGPEGFTFIEVEDPAEAETSCDPNAVAPEEDADGDEAP